VSLTRLDTIEACAERLVVYRIGEPTSSCRAFADTIVSTIDRMADAVGTLRREHEAFHEHAVEVNRLENVADVLLRESLAALPLSSATAGRPRRSSSMRTGFQRARAVCRWHRSARRSKTIGAGTKSKSATPGNPEVADQCWWAVKDSNLGPAD
jgi:hypothetical protein